MLTKDERVRYSRHILLPEVGEEGQAKLKNAKVLVVGAGGLGCPILKYLAAAGVGSIGIIDFDVVEESNLHRQILYDNLDLGKKKAVVAGEKLRQQNPFISVNVYPVKLDSKNAIEIITLYDIVVDGTDNFTTRYLVNDACIVCGKPLVFGSIFKFEGQVTVFNYKGSGSYRCLFPETPLDSEVPNCSEIGVIGVLPGIVGTLQACEVIKMITGIGEVLAGQLLVIDTMTMAFQKYNYKRVDSNFLIRELEESDFSCSPTSFKNNEITVPELEALLSSGKELQIIDVREPSEYKNRNIGAVNIPLKSLEKNIDLISLEKMVVIHCQGGGRSSKAVNILMQNYGFKNLWNLSGGINAITPDSLLLKYVKAMI